MRIGPVAISLRGPKYYSLITVWIWPFGMLVIKWGGGAPFKVWFIG
jgi:hypothetical protein